MARAQDMGRETRENVPDDPTDLSGGLMARGCQADAEGIQR
jgi:hypothetical protein